LCELAQKLAKKWDGIIPLRIWSGKSRRRDKLRISQLFGAKSGRDARRPGQARGKVIITMEFA
jgi:hypothetical protein